ncbi:MAG: Bax inhibitor-1/YccA family protein [Bacilli bacterium]|nr:Bax inhibitor-1/YccA family protein [Bacilli bacterium]
MKPSLYPKTFMWLFGGLLVSFITGYALYLNETILANVFSSKAMWLLIILELGVAIFFSVRIKKMSKVTAIFCYALYSFLTGFTFGVIFITYELASIILVFGITSVLFLIFALYGYFTKRDISKWGSFLLMALIGIILCSIVNIFLHSSVFDLVLSIVGIIIFLGFIAYDIQKLKALDDYIGEDKAAIFGAFQLYLDFINLFIRLLELFGKVKD